MHAPGTKLSTDQELLVIETWGRLVHNKLLRDKGATSCPSKEATIRQSFASNAVLEPEPEPEPEPELEPQADLQQENAGSAFRSSPSASEAQPGFPRRVPTSSASLNSEDGDVVTATATATSPIITHGAPTGDIAGTPSPSRDDSAAARAALVVGASMVALATQPIRRTDKMRNGAKHVIGTLHEGELFVIVAVHERGTSDLNSGGSGADAQSFSPNSLPSLVNMVLEIRCDDLAPVPSASDSYATLSSIPGFIRATDRQVRIVLGLCL